MKFEKLLNVLTGLLLVGVIFQQGSLYLQNQRAKNQPAPTFTVPLVSGGEFNTASMQKPLVVIFWATWCGPCQIELSRVNRMIKNKEISADSVLAISSGEDLPTVSQAAKERDYAFPIGLDVQGAVAQSYAVSVTPTLVFIGKDQTIQWRSSGLSPLLGYRIENFLRE